MRWEHKLKEICLTTGNIAVGGSEPSSTGSIQLSWIPILWIPYKMLLLSILWGVGYILFLIFCFLKSKVLVFFNKIYLHTAFEAALNAEAGPLHVNDIDKHISRLSFKNKRIIWRHLPDHSSVEKSQCPMVSLSTEERWKSLNYKSSWNSSDRRLRSCVECRSS